MNMTHPARQRGLTMLGFLFVTVIVVIAALISFRVIPAYIEYFSVQKALEGALNDSKDLSRADVRRLVERRLGAEYIDSVHASDIEVIKSGNVTTASASWQTKLHLIGNASILLDFDASASR
jgi:predicted membrane chloride channel (bestrophin family)